MQPDIALDLSGLNCPLPILRAKKALATMESGTVLSVLATDPGAPKDFEAFCRQTGNVHCWNPPPVMTDVLCCSSVANELQAPLTAPFLYLDVCIRPNQ